MRKTVLIPWSGGMDSTYLIQHYGERGYEVYAGYIELENNEIKSTMELQAIKKLDPLLTAKYDFRYLGTMFKADIAAVDQNRLSLSQPLVWLTALAYNTYWYDEVALGYVMSDQGVSWLSDFRDIWQSFSKLSPSPEKWPKLSFPLIKHHKTDMWHMMDKNIRELCVWCEEPIDDEMIGWKPCGKCAPCCRRIREKFDNRTNLFNRETHVHTL